MRYMGVSVPELRDGDIIVVSEMFGKITGHRQTRHLEDPVTGKVYCASAPLFTDAECTTPVTRATLEDVYRGLTSWVLADGSIVRDWYDVPDAERDTAQPSWGVQGNKLAIHYVISRLPEATEAAASQE